MSRRFNLPTNYFSNKRKADECRAACAEQADRLSGYFVPIDINFRPGTFPRLTDNEIAKIQNLSGQDACTYICYNRS